jgi:homoserine O-acetyltransferase
MASDMTNPEAEALPAPEEKKMEIHKLKPVHNWRDFIKEIGTIVIGVCIALAGLAGNAHAAPSREGDFAVRNFTFRSGETLDTLRLHYTLLGKPVRDRAGHITNAVMILHGTSSDGHQFFQPQFSDVLFASGGLLDPEKYFIVLPDSIGHGKSSKPSDGMHAHFPKYGYDDMVAAQYLLLTQGLHVDHLRLLLGTSMGCMHAFVWGETHPDFSDALMALACLPVPLAGRNRIWRKLAIDAITSDPAWEGGDYKAEPRQGLRMASAMRLMSGSAALQLQKQYPSRAAADAYAKSRTDDDLSTLDANDVLYQFDASRDYDPSPALERITAPLMWVNSADDFSDPPELGIAEQEVTRLKRGRFVLIPISDQTHGHNTHSWAAVWKDYLAELLKISAH